MNKKRGLIVLVVLVSFLTFANAAWIFFYERQITTNIIGEETTYTITQEFDNSLELNTTSGQANITTLMKIEGLNEDINISFEIETRRTNLTSQIDCPDYDDDCGVVVTHIYNGSLVGEKILSYKPSTIGDDTTFILFSSPTLNFIEYRIECVEDSCPQRISSNITLEEIK